MLSITSCYGAIKLHEHGMKVVERVLKNTLCIIVTLMKCNLT